MRTKGSGLISQRGLVKLTVLFLVSFFLPGLLLVGGASLLSPGSDTSNSQTEDEAEGKRAFLVKSRGDYVRVADVAGIEPAGDSDFLLGVSLKFLSLPARGEKTFLFQKYDKDAPNRQGMALAFTGDADGIHPLVYWRNTEGFGRWFRFAAIQVPEKDWFGLALSFLRGELLGLHLITLQGNEQIVSALGGYRFDAPVYPESDSDFILGGSKNGAPLEARLGGILIAHQTNLTEGLPDVLSGLSIDPASGDLVSAKSVKTVMHARSLTDKKDWLVGGEFVSRFRKGQLIANGKDG